ncbi:MAG: hypothetical protein O2895_03155 [Chloroflexi bacterium]|nr:hypothetical protein [Chloroflexota bacterium]
MPRTRWPILVGLLLFGGVLLASCGDDDDDDAAATATATEAATETATATDTATEAATATATKAAAEGAAVSVSLSEWAVAVDPASIEAGEVTFTVANAGAVAHEFVIIRSDLAADALPVEGGLVPEADVDFVAEIEEFPASTTERLTVGLSAGDYILLCNVPAHYGLGMTVGFTVN